MNPENYIKMFWTWIPIYFYGAHDIQFEALTSIWYIWAISFSISIYSFHWSWLVLNYNNKYKHVTSCFSSTTVILIIWAATALYRKIMNSENSKSLKVLEKRWKYGFPDIFRSRRTQFNNNIIESFFRLFPGLLQ